MALTPLQMKVDTLVNLMHDRLCNVRPDMSGEEIVRLGQELSAYGRELQLMASHHVETCSSFLEPGYWAECSCGWKSADGLASLEAQRQAAIHVETS